MLKVTFVTTAYYDEDKIFELQQESNVLEIVNTETGEIVFYKTLT